MFHPAHWNVHEATLLGNAIANNFCEFWNCDLTNPAVNSGDISLG